MLLVSLSLAFSDHLFDPVGLEDMIWAHDEIQLGYGIQYVPSAEAVRTMALITLIVYLGLRAEASIRSFKYVLILS